MTKPTKPRSEDYPFLTTPAILISGTAVTAIPITVLLIAEGLSQITLIIAITLPASFILVPLGLREICRRLH